MTSVFLRSATLALALGVCVPAMAATLNNDVPQEHFDFSAGRLFVFGDSLSDTGNLYAATQGAKPTAAAYYNGRFTNGKIWHEYLKSGLALDPFLQGVVGPATNGINFAHGGAETGSTVPPGAVLQSLAYAGLVQAGAITPSVNDVQVLWIGGNDFLNAATAGVVPDVQAMVGRVQTTLNTLEAAGARKIIVMEMPPLGITGGTPAATLSPANQLVKAYDEGIRVRPNAGSATAADIIYVDVQGMFYDVKYNPSVYGLTNVADACLRQGLVLDACPAGYFEYDGTHPTKTIHQQLAQYVQATVNSVNNVAGTTAAGVESLYQLNWSARDALWQAAQQAEGKGLSAYAIGRYLNGRTDGDAGHPSQRYDGTLSGFGLGYGLTDRWTATGQFVYVNADGTVGGSLAADNRYRQWAVALGTAYRDASFTAQAMAGYATGNWESVRQTSFSYRPTVTSKTDVTSYFLSGSMAGRVQYDQWTVEPYVGLTYARLETDAFQENGVLLAAAVDAVQVNSLIGTLGVKADYPVTKALKAGWRAGLSKDFDGKADVVAHLQRVVIGSADSLTVGRDVYGSAAATLTGEVTAGLSLQGEAGTRFNGGFNDYYGQLAVRVKF